MSWKGILEGIGLGLFQRTRTVSSRLLLNLRNARKDFLLSHPSGYLCGHASDLDVRGSNLEISDILTGIYVILGSPSGHVLGK